MKLFILDSLRMAVLGAVLLCAVPLHAQDTSSVNQAFEIARTAVAPPLQTKVVSVYGLGTPDAIHKWYFMFYSPNTASHGRAVLVADGKIVKTYDAQARDASGHLIVYHENLSFDPARITSEQPALNAAQNYAARHNIAYNGVRALLKQVKLGHPFRWRIELIDNGASRGFVLVNAVDDTVAAYVPPNESSSGGGGGSVEQDFNNFGNDVQKTFLGIGGDLEEFFTGERTVDR